MWRARALSMLMACWLPGYWKRVSYAMLMTGRCRDRCLQTVAATVAAGNTHKAPCLMCPYMPQEVAHDGGVGFMQDLGLWCKAQCSGYMLQDWHGLQAGRCTT